MPNIGIIDVINNLPIGILTPVLDTDGPYSGGINTITTWHAGAVLHNVNDTFGVIVQINGAIAPELGRVLGYDDGGAVNLDVYDMRLTQVAVLHQMFGGAWIPTQSLDVHYAPYLIRWVEAAPGKLGLYVSPTWSVDLYFLFAL